MSFTKEQQEAITWFEGPMMVIGTPGSGKTTVIVNRINNLIYEHKCNPKNILVITFTKAAAQSMRERFLDLSGLEDTEVRFGTFHSFFFWIIRTAYGKQFSLEVLDENNKRNIIRTILRKLSREMYDSEEVLSSVINQLGIMSCNMIDIDYYHSRDISDKDFRKLYATYKEYKTRHNLLDFDDMVTECYKLLRDREDILNIIRIMYPYIMVDEYQDTNRIQYEILKMLAHPNDNIYVVGDDDQSIYGFRGARPEVMLKFKEEFPGAETRQLTHNFRCPATIVNLSDHIISNNKKRFKKELKSAVDRKGKISIDKVKDASEENKLVIKRIDEAIKRGIQPEDIAILYRTNIGPRRLMYKLRLYNIPFYVRDYIPDISNNLYVKPIIDYIRYALGVHDRETFLNIMNKPVRYISRDMLTGEMIELSDVLRKARGKDYLVENVRRMMAEIRTISNLTPFASVNYIRKAIGYDSYLKRVAEERNMDYDEISDVVDEFQAMIKDTKDFDEMFEMLRNEKEEAARQENLSGSKTFGPEIQLMTLHSAKGLEFSEVHILDAVEGNIPHKKSKSVDEIEEERRLLYVGITRSSNNLYIYVPEEIGDKKVKPSRFIEMKGINDGTK